MRVNSFYIILLIFIGFSVSEALESNQLLVIANNDMEESLQIARHYFSQRGVPKDNVLALSLGAKLNDTISRQDYDRQLAEPIRERFSSNRLLGKIGKQAVKPIQGNWPLRNCLMEEEC